MDVPPMTAGYWTLSWCAGLPVPEGLAEDAGFEPAPDGFATPPWQVKVPFMTLFLRSLLKVSQLKLLADVCMLNAPAIRVNAGRLTLGKSASARQL